MDYNKPNPILDQLLDDPFKAQKEHQRRLDDKNVEFQRLCFEIFHMSSDGKKLYQILLDTFIIPSKVSPSDPQAMTMAIYWEGFKDALRGLYNHGLVHQKRINEGQLR